jgi:hypothetical protein
VSVVTIISIVSTAFAHELRAPVRVSD